MKMGGFMETKNIQEFLALAELGSSYAAAEKLFVSQSSLVRHIQAIEEKFGVPLFDRTRRGFVLNANGQVFLPYAEKIAMTQAMCYNALHHEAEETNTIRLSAETKIIDLMIDFKKEFPQYNLEYVDKSGLEEKVRTGAVDVAFVTNVVASPEELVMIPFCREELLALVYESHPLADRASVRLEELREEKFVALCEDVIYDEVFIELFQKIGFTQKITASVPVGTDLIEMVREGFGITLIHGKADTAPPSKGLKLIRIDPEIKYDISMCYRSNVRLSKAAADFVNFTKKWRILNKNIDYTMLS